MIDIPKSIGSVVDWLLQIRGEERKETKMAAAALRKAAVETDLLLSLIAAGVKPTHEQKAAVARLWAEASTEFRTVDREVSNNSFEVSRFIAQSSDFTDETRTVIAGLLQKVLDDGIRFSRARNP